MFRPFLAATAAFASISFASAQTIVVPPGFDSTEGTTSSAYPWGRGAAFIRVQYYYDTAQFGSLGILGPVLVTGFRWRANGTTAISAGGTYSNVVIDLSSSLTDYLAPNLTFDQNHGLDRTNVYSGNVLALPTVGTTPNNWYVDIDFTTPFLYDPSLGSDFLVDVTIPAASFVGTTPTAVDLEGVFTLPTSINGCRIWTTTATSAVATSGIQAIVAVIDLKLAGYAGRTTFGIGCGSPLALAAGRPVLGTTAGLDVGNIPAGTVVSAVLIGLTGFQPGIDLSPLGMTGCSQYASTDSIHVFVAAGTTHNFSLPVPNLPVLAGLHAFSQALTFSSGFNPLGLIASNGVDLKLGM